MIYFLTILCLWVLAAQSVAATLEPTPQNSLAAMTVSQSVASEHFSGQPLNDELSVRVHELYLEVLDPLKLYFRNRDISRFSESALTHDDAMRKGDLSFPFFAFQVFLQRRQQALGWAREYLRKGFPLDVASKIYLDGEAAAFADTTQEQKKRWLSRIRYYVLERLEEGRTLEQARQEVLEDLQRENHFVRQTTGDELTEMYLNAVMRAYDPHSSYMSPNSIADYLVHLEGSLEGIGVKLRQEKGELWIDDILKGSGADEEGSLKPKEKITAISQDGKEFTDVEGTKFETITDLIRGKEGTTVYLRVEDAAGATRTVSIARKRIVLEDNHASGYRIQVNQDGKKMVVGIIDLPSFYSKREEGISSAKDVFNILRRFHHEGRLDAVIFDLRDNGGGVLQEAVDMGGTFLGKVPIVQVADSKRQKKGKVYRSEVEQLYSGPLMVLINRGSASASEVLAGAIQDHGRGIIVGDSSSYGKGSVQNIAELAPGLSIDLGTTKITVEGYFRPSGETTQHVGVIPDVIFSSALDLAHLGEGSLTYSMPFKDIDPASPKRRVAGPAVLQMLQRRHDARMKQDAELKELKTLVRQHRLASGAQTIYFRPSTLQRRGDEIEKRVERLDTLGAFGKGKGEPFSRETPFTLELLAILGDYLTYARPGQKLRPRELPMVAASRKPDIPGLSHLNCPYGKLMPPDL